jgi:hypothetical protein
MKGYVLPHHVVILCLLFITAVNIHVSASTLPTSVLLYVLFRLVINVYVLPIFVFLTVLSRVYKCISIYIYIYIMFYFLYALIYLSSSFSSISCPYSILAVCLFTAFLCNLRICYP